MGDNENDKLVKEVQQRLEKRRLEAEQKLTLDNYENLTFSEIIKYNKDRKIGSFMSREWISEMNKGKNPYEDPELTKKKKFMSGYYSFPFLSRYIVKQAKNSLRDIEFLQLVLERNNLYSKARKGEEIEQQEPSDIEPDRVSSKLIEKKVVIKWRYYTYAVTAFLNISLLFILTPLWLRKFKVFGLIPLIPCFIICANSAKISMYLNINKILAPIKEKEDSDIYKEYLKFKEDHAIE